MLRYLQWLSIAGVWLPVAILAGWGFVSWGLGWVSPEAGWGLTVIGAVLVFAFSHALAISSVVGAGLLATRHASRPAFTFLSVIVGGLISAFVLSRIYFNAGA